MWDRFENYLARISDYGIEAVIELLLIAAIVYAVLRFLRGTRGAPIFEGLAVVLVALLILRVVSALLGQDRLTVLFQPLLVAVFFGALIMFQPELRRGMMRLAANPWLNRLNVDRSRTIDALVRAAMYLSKNRIGAIVAIEREVPMGAIIDTGITLDAEISAELLQTIFWPGSALHDLGVVIQQDRVVAAVCQFPIAEDKDIDRSLGSRHRAALGLSEECDATIIAVSEETGTISLAVNGRMKRGLDADELREDLRHLLNLNDEAVVGLLPAGAVTGDVPGEGETPRSPEKMTKIS